MRRKRGGSRWVSFGIVALLCWWVGLWWGNWNAHSLTAVSAEFDWGIPYDLPAPLVPEDNPMNAAKVQMGRHLFYDPRLSITGSLSCEGCHHQALALRG